MADRAIRCARIFDGHVWHDDAVLLIDGAHSAGVVTRGDVPAGTSMEDAQGSVLAPGFVDLQVNGGGGVLFNEQPTLEGIRTICQAHARFGTTALLPTLITDTPQITEAAIGAAVDAARASVPGFLGLHLEGPHLSWARRGAHREDLVRPMEESDLRRLVDASAALPVLLVTIAPENVTPDQVARLVAGGVRVSLGHTECSRETALAYVAAGAGLATHLFNAMSPLGHREPGLVGAVLDESALSAGLIADGFHVDPAVIRIALRAKAPPGRIFLVTDAMATIGTDMEGFILNGRKVHRSMGRLTLDDGTLAGADIDMAASVRFLENEVGLPFETSLLMTSRYPAEAIGIGAAKGMLRRGADADFVELDDACRVVRSHVGGVHAFDCRHG
ncbi:N-acetylglucosamine-6-phosphate deacetylase [Oricola cellulosilytica]|uniref:N-acetylglucosamine-6-phosphate deacetylase n=2 Tax=Oricola cellulosilytica TaxID=1429082 RepID=A0A4R0PCD1_9HYPH|nr:N-acetylglucosamine-6-phosphate deacetylase [Oricola cellulosilytica]TCD15121.1 N-acetylglucosamine-6-phosphate deacetylase [Oricola cellulosilytica]